MAILVTLWLCDLVALGCSLSFYLSLPCKPPDITGKWLYKEIQINHLVTSFMWLILSRQAVLVCDIWTTKRPLLKWLCILGCFTDSTISNMDVFYNIAQKLLHISPNTWMYTGKCPSLYACTNLQTSSPNAYTISQYLYYTSTCLPTWDADYICWMSL